MATTAADSINVIDSTPADYIGRVFFLAVGYDGDIQTTLGLFQDRAEAVATAANAGMVNAWVDILPLGVAL